MEFDIRDSLDELKKLAPHMPEIKLPELSAPEQLRLLGTGRLKKRACDTLHRADLRKAGLAACAVMAGLTVVSLTGQYRFHKRIVSGELKKQLAPIKRQLDELQAENAELRAELEKKNAECPEAQTEKAAE